MKSTDESQILSKEHYELLNLGFERHPAAPPPEQSVREFNAELLHRVGDFRKRNLELQSIESSLRKELASLAKNGSEKERELNTRYQVEIEALKRALKDQELAAEQKIEAANRKLTQLSDEKWNVNLELTTMKRELETERAQRAELEIKVEALETNHARAGELIQELETSYEALRQEYEGVNHSYQDAAAQAKSLQAQIQNLHSENQAGRVELERKLRETFEIESHGFKSENAKLRDLLSQRDTRHEEERIALQTSREQLMYLERHLQTFQEQIRRSRSELIRIAKLVETEISFAIEHPFKDYAEMADLEIKQVQTQLSGTSSMSPLRAKLESRLASATTHHKEIRAILDNSESEMQAHAATVKTLLKGLESLR